MVREKVYWWEGIFDFILLGVVWFYIVGCCVVCGIDWVVGVFRKIIEFDVYKKNWYFKYIKIFVCFVCYENFFIRDFVVIILKEFDYYYVYLFRD